MLVPAILYKEQIKTEFQKRFYTMDMLYETGCNSQWCPDISDEPEEGVHIKLITIQSMLTILGLCPLTGEIRS